MNMVCNAMPSIQTRTSFFTMNVYNFVVLFTLSSDPDAMPHRLLIESIFKYM